MVRLLGQEGEGERGEDPPRYPRQPRGEGREEVAGWGYVGARYRPLLPGLAEHLVGENNNMTLFNSVKFVLR